MRLAVNGYGRIGQSVLRAWLERPACREALQIVAINELADAQTVAYLTRYDSVHGRLPFPVQQQDASLQIDCPGQSLSLHLFRESDPRQLPWKDLQIDLVLECSGSFADRETAGLHLQSGARRLLFSHPANADVDAILIHGVNHTDCPASARILSAGSCTTNAVAAWLLVLDQAFGLELAGITTVHAAMNDQPVIDAFHHQDLRRTRSALCSMVPVETRLARGLERVLPALTGKLEANALRVPIVNGSLIDLTVYLSRPTTLASLQTVLQEAACQDPDTLGYSHEALTSVDYIHDSRSGIIDGSLVQLTGGRMAKIMIWFDNEWGFANRMLDLAGYLDQVQKETLCP